MKELLAAVHSVYKKIEVIKVDENHFRVNVPINCSKDVRKKIKGLKNYVVTETIKPEVEIELSYKIYRILVVEKRRMKIKREK